MTSALIIPDSHCSPEVSNRRYEWLGNIITERRPDYIVDLGDWADMSTLGVYDKGTKAAWGKTYKDEVEHVRKANDLAFGASIKKLNRANSKNKKAKYEPTIFRLGGNHDAGRYDTFVHKNPEWLGHISIDDLGYNDHGCTYVPFLKPQEFEGVWASHYWYVKTQKYPMQTARQVLMFNHKSSISGHSHGYDYATSYDISGKRIQALIAGCYLDPSEEECGAVFDYAGEQTKWVNGLTYLHDLRDGNFDMEFISIERVKREYA